MAKKLMKKSNKTSLSSEHPIVKNLGISRTYAQHLERLINTSMRFITKNDTKIDELFVDQVHRLKRELARLKKKK